MLPYVQAILSSVLFNLSLVVQAIDAKKAPAELSMRPGLLFYLMRRWLWMTGNAMNVGAAVLQILAFEHLPVAVVQSIGAGGILLVPLVLRERPKAGQVLALMAIVSGLAVAMASTPPQDTRLTVPPWALFAVTASVALAGVITALKFRRAGTLVAAGICFAASTLMSKVFGLPDAHKLVSVALLVGAGAAGFLAQTTALQTISPARVGPVVMAMSTALPIFLAPALFSESWPRPLLTIASTLVVIAGAAYLASMRCATATA
jgi:drug/metabolite transporter (DMT)-like permease